MNSILLSAFFAGCFNNNNNNNNYNNKLGYMFRLSSHHMTD